MEGDKIRNTFEEPLCVMAPDGKIYRGTHAQAKRRLAKGWKLANKAAWKAQGRKMIPVCQSKK